MENTSLTINDKRVGLKEDPDKLSTIYNPDN